MHELRAVASRSTLLTSPEPRMPGTLSTHFANRKPSPIRQAQIAFAERPDRDEVHVVNLAIGNVSLPMHPAMQARMRDLGAADSPFADGVVKYTASVGTEEAQRAFLHVIGSAGVDTTGLGCVVTDGGSQAMELMILGTCGPKGERPLALLDPAYTNYMDIARRVGARTVSVRREFGDDGSFSLPDLARLEGLLAREKPAAVVIIPADNPTGQLMRQEDIGAAARLCVAHDAWLVSDEAYRQLHYVGGEPTSVWRVTEAEAPGISGRRISIESASKVWNACGLRVGALVTDHAEFRARAVAEYTANLSSNAIGQYIFGALAHERGADLRAWYDRQRGYYAAMMREVATGLRAELPGLIVTKPEASLYAIIDVRNVAPPDFQASAFVHHCATVGRVPLGAEGDHTLLISPLGGFYGEQRDPDPAATQMRLAFVAPPDEMKKVPRLFAALFRAYCAD